MPVHTEPQSATVERLEHRRMLATAVSMNDGVLNFVPNTTTYETLGTPVTHTGTLVVKGGSGDDRISVIRDGNKVKYSSTVAGANTFTVVLDAAKIKRVLVEADGGDDRVFVDDELQKPCTVVGGSGDDRIEGNSGATLLGGSGNDKLEVPPAGVFVATGDGEISGIFKSSTIGPALLSGGDGDDVLVARGTDSVVGGRGNDTAIDALHYNAPPPQSPKVDARTEFGNRASGIERFLALITVGSKDQIFAETLITG